MLQRVAACCSVLQCDFFKSTHYLWVYAACCSALQCVAVCYCVLQFNDARLTFDVCASSINLCSVLQSVAACCSVLQCVAECCSVLSKSRALSIGVCSVLQCVAVLLKTLAARYLRGLGVVCWCSVLV